MAAMLIMFFLIFLFVYIILCAHVIIQSFEFLKGQILYGMLNHPYQLLTTEIV